MSTENANRQFSGEYRLDVEDFGPIAKAKVDLRPLTVFVGPSNTGKSYLAILLYTLHKCLDQVNVSPLGPIPRYRSEPLASIVQEYLDADDDNYEILESFRSWILRLSEDKLQRRLPFEDDPHSNSQSDDTESGSDTRPYFPSNVDSYLRSIFEFAEGFGKFPEAELRRCYGVENMSNLVRLFSSRVSATVKLSIPRLNDNGMVQYDFHLHKDGVKSSGVVSGTQSLSSEAINVDQPHWRSLYSRRFRAQHNAGYEELKYMLGRTAGEIFTSLLGPLCRSVFYLPADRTGVMHSHQVVVSTLVQSATTAGLRPSVSIPLLSGVLADFLSRLIEISAGKEQVRLSSPYDTSHVSDRLAKRIEQQVLQGTVEVKDIGTGYPSFEYVPDGWSDPLPLMRASSMVSEIVPVVLYLRYLVRPGDVLIIEEPESHLHPGMQVEFTRQLAGLVRAGIRVIVTTHSEWVLQELANVVRASQLPESERADIGGGNVALEPDQVGAWLFRPDESGGGSRVSEIPLDDESGLYPTDFEDVAIAMHNEWAEISSRLGQDE